MASADFVESLPQFDHFNEITVDAHFRSVPEDWMVVVADIAGSTRAISEGRYRHVNTLGAACIAATQNALGTPDFLYVFGGDGATIVVPPDSLSVTTKALSGVAALAQRNYGMSLRVGAIAVSELVASGVALEVARHRLAGQRTLAMFRGGGLALADRKIKGQYEHYGVADPTETHSNLQGLSCRWEAIPAKMGRTLTLLVAGTQTAPPTIYQEVLGGLDAILDGDTALANPVHPETMHYRSVWENLKAERRHHKVLFSRLFLRRCLEIIWSVLVFKFGMKTAVFDQKQYTADLGRHSDFRKFDDTLRMVIDCTPEQIQKITRMLQALRDRGHIHYGLHEAGEALMTCLVQGLSEGQHIHFIDGADGGYALAARQMKGQMKDDAGSG